MLEVQFGQASDPGTIRNKNEDAMGSFIPASRQQARTHGYLFAVADGFGGAGVGDIASSTAISVLMEEFAKAQEGSMLISLLPRLIQSANEAVHDRVLKLPSSEEPMATTITACALRDDQAVICHVGDSRCYLIRNGMAKQVTQDHTRATECKAASVAATRDGIGMSTRRTWPALGPEMTVAPDTTAVTLHPSDVLVLCTDGVHAAMGIAKIAEVAAQPKSADEIARQLVARALESGRRNNTTAQVIRVRSVEQAGVYRSSPYSMPFRP